MKAKHCVIIGAAVPIVVVVIAIFMHAQGDESTGWTTMKGPVAIGPYRATTPPATTQVGGHVVVIGPALGPRPDDMLPPRRAAMGAAISASKDGMVLVQQVLPGSPAASVGLQAGDEIVGLNDDRKLSFIAYMKAMANFEPGDEIKLQVIRAGQQREFTLTLMSVDDPHMIPPRMTRPTTRMTTRRSLTTAPTR
jgi:S1-C subfamily serine protease